MMQSLFENWLLLKAAVAAFVGYGAGLALGIAMAVLTAIKEDIRDWWNNR